MQEKNSMMWVPEICYEEVEDGMTSNIPFINVPDDKTMPGVIFIFESRETGEFEPGPEGEDLPVTELDLHQYANMSHLKERLPLSVFDQVRTALGLEPLKDATEKGQKITQNVRDNLS